MNRRQQNKNAPKRERRPVAPDAIPKKVHHLSKLVHKEVKKAKQFEARKIARRLKQAIQEKNEPSVIQKLETQLAAAKAIDLDALTKKAIKPVEEIAGIQQPTNNDDIDDNDDADADPISSSNSDIVIANRIFTATCVQKAVNQAKTGIIQLLKAMKGVDSEQEQQLEGFPASHNNNNKTEEEEAPSSEHTLPSSSSEGEGAPSEIDSEAEEALSKLLKVKEQHGMGDDSEEEVEDNGHKSDSDSGLINLDEDDKRWLTEEGLLQELSSVESLELNDEDSDGFNSEEAEEEEEGGDGYDKEKMAMKKGQEDGKKGRKQQPKKKKNRLGQRARRRLVETAAGRPQYNTNTNRAPYNNDRQSGRRNETAFNSRSPAHDPRRPAATRTRVVPEKEEDLHPSWAAKKKKLPLIAPAAGKKIRFDD